MNLSTTTTYENAKTMINARKVRGDREAEAEKQFVHPMSTAQPKVNVPSGKEGQSVNKTSRLFNSTHCNNYSSMQQHNNNLSLCGENCSDKLRLVLNQSSGRGDSGVHFDYCPRHSQFTHILNPQQSSLHQHDRLPNKLTPELLRNAAIGHAKQQEKDRHSGKTGGHQHQHQHFNQHPHHHQECVHGHSKLSARPSPGMIDPNTGLCGSGVTSANMSSEEESESDRHFDIDDDDSSSEESNCTCDEKKDGKFCDCCHSKLSRHGGPPVASTSKKYIERRDKLRFMLEREKFFNELQVSFQSSTTLKKLFRGRIMLVGAYGAGKTSTKRSLFNEPHQTEHRSTHGAEIYSIDITQWIIKGPDKEYKGAKSIKELQELLADIIVGGLKKSPSSGGEEPATHAEVKDVVDAVKMEGEQNEDVYRRLQKDLFAKTTLDGSDANFFFSLWDFAGQGVYYITHQVFLASRVIYILVTDLTKSLDDMKVECDDSRTVGDFLSFWINSIHTHTCPESEVHLKQPDRHIKTVLAPPVIILGTKKDLLQQAISKDAPKLDVDDEANERLLEIERHLRKHSPRAVNAHIVKKFAIDNKSRKRGDGSVADPEVETLRQTIQQLAMEYFFQGEVPAKWIRLELLLRQQQIQKMTLDEVKTLGRQLKMEEAEIKAALAFFHSVGEILFFESIPELKNTVILDVSWLVDLFKILINKDISIKERIRYPSKILNLLEEFHDEGRLHEELVDYLLKSHNREEDKVILLEIMELYDIMCKAPVNPKEKIMYYLPSLLQKDAEGEDSVIFPEKHSSCYQLYYHFKGNFLPEGLFYRLIIRCLRHWSTQGNINAVVLRKVKARIFIERHQFHLTICKEGSDIQLQVLIPSREKHSIKLQPKELRDIRLVVEKELNNLISTYTPGLNYQASMKCKCRSHVVGTLLPGAEDVDDRCTPISEMATTMLCPKSALPSHGPDLDIWSVTEAARTDKSDKGRGREDIDPLSDLFYTLENNLTDEDARHMINLLTPTQISPRDAEKLKTPFAIFNDLRQKGYISENDLELLKKVLRRMRKAVLLLHIDKYLQREGHY